MAPRLDRSRRPTASPGCRMKAVSPTACGSSILSGGRRSSRSRGLRHINQGRQSPRVARRRPTTGRRHGRSQPGRSQPGPNQFGPSPSRSTAPPHHSHRSSARRAYSRPCGSPPQIRGMPRRAGSAHSLSRHRGSPRHRRRKCTDRLCRLHRLSQRHGGTAPARRWSRPFDTLPGPRLRPRLRSHLRSSLSRNHSGPQSAMSRRGSPKRHPGSLLRPRARHRRSVPCLLRSRSHPARSVIHPNRSRRPLGRPRFSSLSPRDHGSVCQLRPGRSPCPPIQLRATGQPHRVTPLAAWAPRGQIGHRSRQRCTGQGYRHRRAPEWRPLYRLRRPVCP